MGQVNRVIERDVVVGLCGPLYAAGDEVRPVVVLVDDRARIQPHILDLAEKQAARIYKQAGARMVWRSAREPVVNAGFTVRLVIQAEFRGASGGASLHLMGAAPDSAVECGGVAYLFFDQIIAFSNILLLDRALVLGTVAAHEVGHKLLPGQGHSARLDAGVLETRRLGTRRVRVLVVLTARTAGSAQADLGLP
jgi:hypothetical protein